MSEQPITAEQILAGDSRAIARAATWIENGEIGAGPLLRSLAPRAGRALVLGVTGPPGAGKSTLCDQMIRILRSENQRVAVIAVDPSSPQSGGAILGDRVRMQQHHSDHDVFIRSMATRGILGGLAATTAQLTTLLDAAGYNVVIVETVGVGQAEVEIAKLADVTVVVLAPGMGDDVQAMKAGLLEIASVFVINKSDLPGADQLAQDLMSFQSLSPGGQPAPILKTVASKGAGVAEVLDAARARRDPRGPQRRAAQHPDSLAESPFKIDHLGIAVRSLDDALKFYSRQLGICASERETVTEEMVNVAMLPLGGSRIELLEPSNPSSVIAQFLDKRGEGLHHVALRVPDLTATVARLQTAGARILNEPRKGAGGHLYVFVHPSSTGGVLLELIQDS